MKNKKIVLCNFNSNWDITNFGEITIINGKFER